MYRCSTSVFYLIRGQRSACIIALAYLYVEALPIFFSGHMNGPEPSVRFEAGGFISDQVAAADHRW